MRRVAIAAVLVLAAVAACAPAAAAPPRETVSGKIVALKPAGITIQGARRLSCRLGAISPRALGFRVGMRAKASCVRGVLKGISRPATAVTVTTTPQQRPPTPLPAPTAPPPAGRAPSSP